MVRLTKRVGYRSEAAPLEDMDDVLALQRVIDRLAAYEDTGLTPEEVNACKHALMGREIAKITEFDGIPLDRLEKICNAEREGRCVVLPCKVRDTVYLIIHGYVEETKVRTFFVGHPSYNRGEPDPRYEMVRCTNYDLPLKDFGKTVFLTREAAEAALKEREKNDN